MFSVMNTVKSFFECFFFKLLYILVDEIIQNIDLSFYWGQEKMKNGSFDQVFNTTLYGLSLK